MKKIALIITVLLICSACKSVEMFLSPDDYIKRDSPATKIYVYDTTYIQNSGGNIVTGGSRPSKQVVFSKEGDAIQIVKGETLEIISDGIDFSIYSFDTEVDESNGNITLKLIDKEKTKILLSSKCQTILRKNTTIIPKIEVAPNLNKAQVVITPYYEKENGVCVFNGYQIRYGSIERGCPSDTVFKRFNECTKVSNTSSHDGYSFYKALGLEYPKKKK